MLDLLYPAILICAGLIMIAIFTSLLAFRFGAPILLVFLAVGLLAGEDGLGLHFDDATTAYVVGNLALAVILFDSGFQMRLASLRQAAGPALALATVGVLVTAGLIALATHVVLPFSWPESLLLGAILSSTDAAALFFLMRVGGTPIRERVRSTLEIESGANDPMAIFLTITLVELIRFGSAHGGISIPGLVLSFVREMGLGVVFGLIGGFLITKMVNRFNFEHGLYPVLVLAASLVIFAAAGEVEGSGFLAVYVAGLYAGNRPLKAKATLQRFQEGMTWLAQIIMFLMLGLLANPARFAMIALPSVLIALVLIFIARPLAVWVCLWPFRFQSSERTFISWVGLRGAVSILLAILPLAEGIDHSQTYFNVAFIVVLTSLLVHGWTITPLATRLGLVIPPKTGLVERVELELPGSAHHELVVYRIVGNSPVALGERVPRWARPSLVIRKGQSMRYQYAGRLQEGDYVYLFAAPRYTRLLDRLFGSPARLAADDDDFFGAFVIDPTKPVAGLAQAYGAQVPTADPELTISRFMADRLGGRAEVGDRVGCGPVDLVVRDTDDEGRVISAGLALEPQAVVGPTMQTVRALLRVAVRIRQFFGGKAKGSRAAQ
ncbi:potassium/proton antiporter, CPA1 family [Faunimonas pinastri]|uniref:Potassium/proton antiporter, CPA1 family n=1 Tax=Faunimonas pinastri TaxID=1855383 RepID=A0A1H9IT57_9HYPH|nr:potassium/proton antiporter [Faunimonas pinastri]SEQ77783.1 potassium/proton antiporter, CPA1 family [Faunimonas pinastri]